MNGLLNAKGMMMNLLNKSEFSKFPKNATIEELVAFSRKALGNRYRGVVKRTYGGGTQIEVLAIKDGYHGREVVRKACYEII